MDAQFVLERLKKNELLKNDSASQWDDVVKKYPYFNIGQWLKYGFDFYKDQGALDKVVLYKSEPLEFAQFISDLKKGKLNAAKLEVKEEEVKEEVTQVEGVIENEEEVKTESTEQPLTIDPLPIIASEEVILQEPTIEEVTKVEVSVEEKDLHSYADIVEEIRDTTPLVEQTKNEEDILELINELPNAAPFELPENLIQQTISTQEESIEEIKVEVQHQNSTEIEEDKSLMVMMSFTDWLIHFKHKTKVEREEEHEKKALKAAWQKEKLAEAADEELDEIPEPIFKQAMDSISMESSLISESLAEILAKQGKKDKAIAMYKKLSLRNPEKSSFFANRINELNLNED